MIDIESTIRAVDPLFRFGIPHERPSRYRPIRTNSHFIMFDERRRSPRYTMQCLYPDAETFVVRTDSFFPELTLPHEMRTYRAHYETWNREHPDNPMDVGHQTADQYRRGSMLETIDVDNLCGCCPETPPLNRNVKRNIEQKIMSEIGRIGEEAADWRKWLQCFVVQGPYWHDPTRPEIGVLESGQWIPDGLFIATLWRSRSRVFSSNVVMTNAAKLEDVQPQQVSLEHLEQLTGLVLWSEVHDRTMNRNQVGTDVPLL